MIRWILLAVFFYLVFRWARFIMRISAMGKAAREAEASDGSRRSGGSFQAGGSGSRGSKKLDVSKIEEAEFEEIKDSK